jgi:hypothetical protein
MAKAPGKRAKDSTEGQAPTSVLEAAWQAYGAGDSLMARRLAGQVVASGGTAKDAETAKRIAKTLFVTGDPRIATPDTVEVARELASRTGPPTKTYLFVGLALGIFLLLTLLAVLRY